MKRLMTAALAVLLAACAGGPGEPNGDGSANLNVPADAASIIGDVKQVEGGAQPTRILVEQIPTRSAGEPIAWVDVTPRTRILARSGGRTSRASAGELAVGARVWVWFDGPVRESFPVQATGGTIIIER
jgi:hypothetical protein